MEAINQLASTASKSIWGDNSQTHNQEPVSGKQGDTSKGEPYDAGNMEPTETSTNTTPATAKTADPSPAQTKDTTSTTTPKTDDTNPAKTKDSSVMAGDSTKAQNDTRSPEEETTFSADDLKGPGPKPVADLAREHGGDAGAVGNHTGNSSGMLDGSDVPPANPTSGTGTGVANAEKTEGTGAAVTETKDHKEVKEDKKKKEEEGTGEQYVKTSGLNADGGNFDATKPGAGREADRLMGEKGIHHVPGKKPEPAPEAATHGKSAAAAAPAAASPDQPKEKKSLGDRIKAKLHHKSGTS